MQRRGSSLLEAQPGRDRSRDGRASIELGESIRAVAGFPELL